MPADLLELGDYRRRVAELYSEVRALEGETAWSHWRSRRDELVGTHSQGLVRADRRADFHGLPYFDHDPAFRTLGTLTPAEPESVEAPRSAGGGMAFIRAGTLGFDLAGETYELELLWLDAYGGGFFLPFRDATSGEQTYGGGRYLLDGPKSADLGQDDGKLVLDFNFSYHPSCAHDPQWSCPLAPPDNVLPIPVTAGERF